MSTSRRFHCAPPARSRRGPLLASVALSGALVLAPAALGASSSRAQKGTSSQGLTIKLSKAKSFGRTFSYQAAMHCSDGTTFTDAVFSDDVAVKKGKFKSRYVSDAGAVRTSVSGTVKGNRASGKLRIIEHYSPTANAQGFLPLDAHGSVVCDSGTVTWKTR